MCKDKNIALKIPFGGLGAGGGVIAAGEFRKTDNNKNPPKLKKFLSKKITKKGFPFFLG